MKFIYDKNDYKDFKKAQENSFLMTNGLGGFSSQTIIGSCSRNDHALLMSCDKEESPNHRYNMIHCLTEKLVMNGEEIMLSSQEFCKKIPSDDRFRRDEGYKYLKLFTYEDYPEWSFEIEDVNIVKRVALLPGYNMVGVSYDFVNSSNSDVSLSVTPGLEFVKKGDVLSADQTFLFEKMEGTKDNYVIISGGKNLVFKTNGEVRVCADKFVKGLFYSYDQCDGRNPLGNVFENHEVVFKIPAGKMKKCEIIYNATDICMPLKNISVSKICERLTAYRDNLVTTAGFANDTAQALVKAADQFVAYRASTGKMTILAGYPFFEDWGRDTMISIVGCCLSTRRFDIAKEILRTFMDNCRDGLMPNLFPEGTNNPMYNTADAALLFIIAIYEYYKRTNDSNFVDEAYPVMESIITHYIEGTDYNIGMDDDGLIHAGSGLDQVTWMDVRVGDILPTPRHGKPVEINAYWYNCLCMMDEMSNGKTHYAELASKVKQSFNEKFWNEKEKCLKDVLSLDESKADYQIRCNQIWAVSLPFSILSPEKEKLVVATVGKKLYTPLGLRTLSPDDPDFHPVYTGEMMERDLAYHQGTTWVFPLGAYYLAYLKVNDYSLDARERVFTQLMITTQALHEGSAGQLPEIYDGLRPKYSKGCFAQAWSVGEMLRVYEALERQRK